MSFNIFSNNGNIKVNKSVIAETAAIRASQCSGVAGMSAKSIKSSIAGLLKPESASKGVDVKIAGENIDVLIHIIVNYGVNISDVSNEIIEGVKSQLTDVLGVESINVGVSVEGILKPEFNETNKSSLDINKKGDVADILGIKSGLVGYIKKEENNYCAIFEDNTLLTENDINSAALKLIEHISGRLQSPAVIALHYIEGLDDKAYELSDLLSEKYSETDIETHCVEGSDYDYIIGVE